MGVHLQLLQLLHLVQHLVHVELGHEELETTVGVGFAAKTERGVWTHEPHRNVFVRFQLVDIFILLGNCTISLWWYSLA